MEDIARNTKKHNKKERKTDSWRDMHCKRFTRMTYLENIEKQDITRFVADDIPENTLITEEKNQEIMLKGRTRRFNIHRQ